MHILFVDDQSTQRNLFQLAFNLQGHTVRLAANGNEAVAAVQAQAFDIIVLDIEMPDGDGLTATRQIRQVLQGQPVPIVLFTGYDYNETAALAVGANLLLHKPILPQQMLEHLTQLVARVQAD